MNVSVSHQFPLLLLLEALSEYHFNSTVIEEIYGSLNADSGRRFYSPTHRLVKDREYLFVSKLKEGEEKLFYIEKNDIELFEPLDFNIEKLDAKDFQMIKDQRVACIDAGQNYFSAANQEMAAGRLFPATWNDRF